MRKRMLAVAVGTLVSAGAFAAAQNPQVAVTARSGTTSPEQVTLTGGVSILVNDVLVRADRAVMKDREVTLEGNVRMTLPAPK